MEACWNHFKLNILNNFFRQEKSQVCEDLHQPGGPAKVRGDPQDQDAHQEVLGGDAPLRVCRGRGHAGVQADPAQCGRGLRGRRLHRQDPFIL